MSEQGTHIQERCTQEKLLQQIDINMDHFTINMPRSELGSHTRACMCQIRGKHATNLNIKEHNTWAVNHLNKSAA